MQKLLLNDTKWVKDHFKSKISIRNNKKYFLKVEFVNLDLAYYIRIGDEYYLIFIDNINNEILKFIGTPLEFEKHISKSLYDNDHLPDDVILNKEDNKLYYVIDNHKFRRLYVNVFNNKYLTAKFELKSMAIDEIIHEFLTENNISVKREIQTHLLYNIIRVRYYNYIRISIECSMVEDIILNDNHIYENDFYMYCKSCVDDSLIKYLNDYKDDIIIIANLYKSKINFSGIYYIKKLYLNIKNFDQILIQLPLNGDINDNINIINDNMDELKRILDLISKYKIYKYINHPIKLYDLKLMGDNMIFATFVFQENSNKLSSVHNKEILI